MRRHATSSLPKMECLACQAPQANPTADRAVQVVPAMVSATAARGEPHSRGRVATALAVMGGLVALWLAMAALVAPVLALAQAGLVASRT